MMEVLCTDLQFVCLDIKTVVEHNGQHERSVMVAKATGLFQQQNYVVFCVKQTFCLLHSIAQTRSVD